MADSGRNRGGGGGERRDNNRGDNNRGGGGDFDRKRSWRGDNNDRGDYQQREAKVRDVLAHYFYFLDSFRFYNHHIFILRVFAFCLLSANETWCYGHQGSGPLFHCWCYYWQGRRGDEEDQDRERLLRQALTGLFLKKRNLIFAFENF